MTQPFHTPFFSDTEFKNLKEILPYFSSQPPQIDSLSNYLEKVPVQNFEEVLGRIRLVLSSMQKESLTPDDFKDSKSVVEIKLTTPIPGSNVDPNSPQYQTICNGINEQLKQRIAQLQDENEQLKNRLQRQGEQFKQISSLADQLINPQGNLSNQSQAPTQSQSSNPANQEPDPNALTPPSAQASSPNNEV